VVLFQIYWSKIPNHEERGIFGDQLGAINALFSGLALEGIIITIFIKMRSDLISLHSLYILRRIGFHDRSKITFSIMKKDTEYELLTQSIYQLLLSKESFNTINVEHDVKLKGISNVKHQIDVYWEFQLADIPHKVAIECKNYKSRISLGRIRDFHSVIKDVGNIYGIMVTKVGYQKGVKEYAKQYGIGLKLLRNPIEEDWDGRLKKVEFNITIVIPKIKKTNINIDQEWVKINIDKEKWNTQIKINKLANEVWILDRNGNQLKNFHQLESKVPNSGKTEFGLKHTYEFSDNYMFISPIGLVKIKSISYDYDVLTGESGALVIDAQEIVDKVLKDVLSNDIKFIFKEDRINQLRDDKP